MHQYQAYFFKGKNSEGLIAEEGNQKRIITCHPSGLRFIKDDDIPVSKSVQLIVPSEDAAYIVPSFAGFNLL